MQKISFIIIGRNEGWKLGLTLKSVFEAIALNKIKDVSEVIYVDSNSNDNSVEIASQFQPIKIIKITDNNFNAAIARNLGASYSTGESLMFLDGDMQLESSFIPKIFDEDFSLQYPFVSGNILEYYYNENWKFLKEAFRTPNGCAYLVDKYEVTVGGFFCVKHSLWDELEGMDSSLTICEDLDLGLRLSKKAIPLLRKKDLSVIHHTISPLYYNSAKNNLLTFNFKYYGLLYRKHLLNKKILKRLARSEFTLFFLIFLSLLSVIFGSIWPIFFYPFFILFRFWYHSRKKFFSFLDILRIPIRDITVFVSFFFFFPQKKNHRCEHLRLKKYSS